MANPLSAKGISDRDYAAAIGTLMGEASPFGQNNVRTQQDQIAAAAMIADVMANRLESTDTYGAVPGIGDRTLADVATAPRTANSAIHEFSTWDKNQGAYKTAAIGQRAALDDAYAQSLPADTRAKLEASKIAMDGVFGTGSLRGITSGSTFYGNYGVGSTAASHANYGPVAISNEYGHTFRGPDVDVTQPFDRERALTDAFNGYYSKLDTPTERAMMDSPMARANPVGVVSYGEALPDISPGAVVDQGAPLQDLTPGAYQTIANDNTGTWGMGLQAPTEPHYGDLGYRDTQIGGYPSAPAPEAPTPGGFATAPAEGGWAGDGGFHGAPPAPMGSAYGTIASDNGGFAMPADTRDWGMQFDRSPAYGTIASDQPQGAPAAGLNTGWGGMDFDTTPARDLSPYGQRQPGDNWSAEQQGVADRRAANDPMAPSVSPTSFGMGFTPQTPAMDRYGMEMSDRYGTMDVTPEARPTMGDYSQEGGFHAAAPANDWSAASSAPEHYGTIASDETGTGSSSRASARSVSPYGFSSLTTTPMASPTSVTGLQPLASAAYEGTVPASPTADPYGMPPTTQPSVTTPRSPTFATNPYAFSMPTAASFAPAAVHTATAAQRAIQQPPQAPQMSQWGQDNGVTGNWTQDTSPAASNARISQLGAQTIDPLTGRMMDTNNGGSPAYSGYTGNWDRDTSVAASNARTAQTGAGVDPVTGQQIEQGGWGMGGFFGGGGLNTGNNGNVGDGTGGLW